MKTWHAVAFLIMTAGGGQGSPWGSLFLRAGPNWPGKINAPVTRAANLWAGLGPAAR